MYRQLKVKKQDLLKNHITIDEVKPYNFLKLIIDVIRDQNQSKVFTKKQQLDFIDKCFQLENKITYDTYIQFIRTYINIKKNSASVEENKRKEQVTKASNINDTVENDGIISLHITPPSDGFKKFKGEIKWVKQQQVKD